MLLLNKSFSRSAFRVRFHNPQPGETIRDQFLKLPIGEMLWPRWSASNTHPRIQVKVASYTLWLTSLESQRSTCTKTRRPNGSFLEKIQGFSAGTPIAHTDAKTHWTPIYLEIQDGQTNSQQRQCWLLNTSEYLHHRFF